jgi:hypothetical protein
MVPELDQDKKDIDSTQSLVDGSRGSAPDGGAGSRSRRREDPMGGIKVARLVLKE